MLYCPNYTCQTPNPETNKFCQKCRTPLPKRYLWTISDGIDTYRPGDLITNRYLYKGSRILLDTKPGLYPSFETDDIPDFLMPYLRLSPYQTHVPQVYDWVLNDPNDPANRLVLLEQAAIYLPTDAAGLPVGGHSTATAPLDAARSQLDPYLLPLLSTIWPDSSALRQFNWLWQIAQLWQPLRTEQVASTLLIPDLIRVEGGLVRLLELHPDLTGASPTLADLGKLWQRWVPTAHPTAAPVLDAICQQLIEGTLHDADQLVAQLDSGLATVDRAQTRHITLSTQTDQGPSRRRNEDACYPASGTVQTLVLGGTAAATSPLVIVCDGIGGHQGGDVASNLAIAAVYQHLQSQPLATLSAAALIQQLEAAACVANDLISQRNDDEQRQERQRMGTTLVIGLVRQHELYITHVGDSRAYWITRWGCHQVTLDDDVASREVRMGYSFYREALQHPSSGSLVQALGVSTSSFLHPTVQRFILDDDSIFLLCSDGLSDNDRVEQYWDSAILPALEGSAKLETTCQGLIDLANTQNGHDNVTIGLIHCRLQNPSEVQPRPADHDAVLPATFLAQPISSQSGSPRSGPPQPGSPQPAAAPDSSTLKTKLVAPKAQPSTSGTRLLPLLASLLLLLVFGGGLAYVLSASVRNWVNPLLAVVPSPSPLPVPTNGTAMPPTALPLPLDSLIQIGRTPADTPSLTLLSAPDPSAAPAAPVSSAPVSTPLSSNPSSNPSSNLAIPAGSVWQIVAENTATPDRWLKLRFCSASGSAADAAAVAPGTEGWIKQKDVEPLALANPPLTPDQRGTCGTSTPTGPISPLAVPSSPPTVPVSPSAAPPPILPPLG